MQRGQVSASCLVQPPEVKPTDEEVKACIKDDKLLFACGKKIPLLSSACVEPLTGVRSQMPVVKVGVGKKCVDVLRDTGCSGIAVKRDLVSEDQFTGDFNVMLLIDNTTTTPYHPTCNGLTEKFNGTMKSMLKRLGSEQPRQWHRYINPLLFAYREVPQESTGFPSFELLYGRAVRGPMFILKELWTKELEEPEVKNSYQYVFELREKLEDTLKLAHTELQKAQNKGKHNYDRKTKIRKFVPGDKVLVLPPADHNKLLMQWKGPFEVSAVVGLNDYKVRVKGKQRVYHANLLKKYFEREDSVPVGAFAVEVNANKHVESEVEEVNPVDNIDFLEIGGYVAKESVNDVAIGDNLSH